MLDEHDRRSAELTEMGPSHPLRYLVYSCLENDPHKRPNAEEVVEQLKVLRLPVESEPKGSEENVARSLTNISRISTESHFEYKFKIIVLGESDVGKSTIIYRFINPTASFPNVLLPSTVALAEHHERLQVRGKWIHLHLVDTAGHDRFHNSADLVPQIYRGVEGAIVAFDVSSRLTFRETRKWVQLVREKLGRLVPIILVGNKTDEETRQVPSERAEEFADKNDLFYIETSAKTRTNIDEIFSVLIDLLMQNKDEIPEGYAYGGVPERCKSPVMSPLNGSLRVESTITQRSVASATATVNPGGIKLSVEIAPPLGSGNNDPHGGQGRGRSKWRCCSIM